MTYTQIKIFCNDHTKEGKTAETKANIFMIGIAVEGSIVKDVKYNTVNWFEEGYSDDIIMVIYEVKN